jgi:hypothetical protein
MRSGERARSEAAQKEEGGKQWRLRTRRVNKWRSVMPLAVDMAGSEDEVRSLDDHHTEDDDDDLHASGMPMDYFDVIKGYEYASFDAVSVPPPGPSLAHMLAAVRGEKPKADDEQGRATSHSRRKADTSTVTCAFIRTTDHGDCLISLGIALATLANGWWLMMITNCIRNETN